VIRTCCRSSLAELFLLFRVGRRVLAIGEYGAQFLSHGLVRLSGVPFRCAPVISADNSAGTMPSLSVVQTLPSRRLNDAPALSSPPNATLPSTSRSRTLETHGHFVQLSAEPMGDSIDHGAAHHGFANAASARQCVRWRNK